jgi:multidrug efflux pump subunit AcrA (membrane-fusion protein)
MKRVRSDGLRRNSEPYSFAGAMLSNLAFSVLLVLIGCNAKPDTTMQGPPPMPVKTQIARPIPIPVTSQYLVSLKSRESAAINPQVEGWVVKISVRSGEHVREGQPILEIDPRVQQATLNNQVEARAAQQAILNRESSASRITTPTNPRTITPWHSFTLWMPA